MSPLSSSSVFVATFSKNRTLALLQERINCFKNCLPLYGATTWFENSFVIASVLRVFDSTT
jgi:hypothetical protein